MRKARVEMREVESIKKQQSVDIEKLRDLDMKKVREEKKALD